jgi:hypothetical protein
MDDSDQSAFVDNLRRHVDRLAGLIGPRHIGAPRALYAAATLIERELSRFGYTIERQSYLAQRIEVANLIAELRGAYNSRHSRLRRDGRSDTRRRERSSSSRFGFYGGPQLSWREIMQDADDRLNLRRKHNSLCGCSPSGLTNTIGTIMDSHSRHSFFLLLISIPVALSGGCNSSSQSSKSSGAPYGEIQLGMSLDEAKRHVDGAGEAREYDSLPARQKPRDTFSKLPPDAQWLVWSGEGKPILVLGIVGGKVAYKQVIRNEGGQLKSDESALPEYQ